MANEADAIAKGLERQGAEMWGREERRDAGKVPGRYIRWVMGVERATLRKVAREEMKGDEARVEAERKVIRFYKKFLKEENRELLGGC